MAVIVLLLYSTPTSRTNPPCNSTSASSSSSSNSTRTSTKDSSRRRKTVQDRIVCVLARASDHDLMQFFETSLLLLPKQRAGEMNRKEKEEEEDKKGTSSTTTTSNTTTAAVTSSPETIMSKRQSIEHTTTGKRPTAAASRRRLLLRFNVLALMKRIVKLKWPRTESNSSVNSSGDSAVEAGNEMQTKTSRQRASSHSFRFVSGRLLLVIEDFLQHAVKELRSSADPMIVFQMCDVIASAVSLRRFILIKDKGGVITGCHKDHVRKRYMRTCLIPLRDAAAEMMNRMNEAINDSCSTGKDSVCQKGWMDELSNEQKHAVISELRSLQIALTAQFS